jgi:hypothetical protein
MAAINSRHAASVILLCYAGIAAAEEYHRLHQIPTRNRDPYGVPMVTPGGMILELPKMVAATDVLTIVNRDDSGLTFELTTVGRDRDQCTIEGLAPPESEGVYVFSENEVILRLTVLGVDRIRIEPVGKGYRSQCDALGTIDSATYTRAAVSR